MNPCDHIKLTKKAIELYLSHADSKHSRLFGDYQRVLWWGSVKEDIYPFHVRLTHWHFFPENAALQPRKTKVLGREFTRYPTSNRICERRVKQLEREIARGKSKGVFELIGRILHHVQDMSTPAHVAPVYHGPLAPDSYESYSKKHIKDRLGSVDVSSHRFEALRSELRGSVDLYDKCARATLDYLYHSGREFPCSVDGGAIQAGWDMFWARSSDKDGDRAVMGHKGFGRYGALGKHFGKTRVEADGKAYQVAPDVFQTLHQDLVQKAVEDSLQVLMFAEARMS